MKRRCEAGSLMSFVVLALSVLGTQMAQAQTHTFTSDSETDKTVLTGRDEPNTTHFLTIGSATLACDHVFLDGTVTGQEVSQLTIHPIFVGTDESEQPTDCTMAGNPTAVRTNDCAFQLFSETDNGHAPIGIECKFGHRFELELTGLETIVTIGAQSPTTGVHYTTIADHESTGHEALTVDTTVEGWDSSCEGAFCFLVETGPETATYEGVAILTGYEDKNTGQPDEPTTPNYGDDENGLVNFTV